MSEMSRWFPMSIERTPRSSMFSDFSFRDDFLTLDRQMRTMQRDMDHMFAHMQRLAPALPGTGDSPLDMRHEEDVKALNPVVTDQDGSKKMQMKFDVRAFKPEEIDVKTKEGKCLEVHAKHEETTDSGTILRQYHRMFSIPQGVDVKEISSVLSPEGVLIVTAPLREPQAAIEPRKEMAVAITHE